MIEVADRVGDRRFWAAAAGAAALGAGLAAQQRFMRRIAADPEEAVLRTPPQGRPFSVTAPDGTRLHAEAFGPEADSAQTLILAHGWTENLTYWTYQIRDLTARELRVVAYDLRGHGESAAATDGDYSIARFGEDLEAVLATALPESRRAVVAGHSLGAMAIAAWAGSHDVERRVSAAALLNTGVGDLIAESLLIPVPRLAQLINRTVAVHGFLGSRAPLPRFSTPLSHAAIRYIAFGPTATPAQVAFYERMLVAQPPDARASIGITLSEIALYQALPRLKVPTIVLGGAVDRLTPPSHARQIAEMLPQLERLTILDDTGHMAPLERHAEVSEALAALAMKVARGADAVPA